MKRLAKRTCFWAPLIAMSLAPAAGLAAEKVDAKALFEARCSICHPYSRPLDKKKTPAEWRETVLRMKAHAAGKISDAEAETIIKYLSEIKGK